ncbi:LysR substrate-binding domain-containing protein [Pseudomonas sp. NPDC007930]|uniref:LysR substrate-binding domain-containing protein n=1 Tax=Pseudomonas sp. NPDC007930 TaxID=3364417 RepID=UPI0036E00C95
MSERFSRLPSLNALRVFEVAARHLNFRLAADELGVTQGAVAQQVRGLEAALAVQLFDRQRRGLALTAAGQAYQGSVRRAFEQLAQATEALRPAPQHLTLSTTPTFAAKWLIPRLPRFSAAHPGIDLRVLASDQLSRFHTDGVDLAVRLGQPPFGPGLEVELLLENTLVAVASPALVERLGLPETAEQWARYPLLRDAHDAWPAFLDRLLPGPREAAPRQLSFNQTSLAIDAAVAGQGAVLASPFFVSEALSRGQLRQLCPLHWAAPGSFYLVSPRKARAPAALQALKAWLRAQAG